MSRAWADKQPEPHLVPNASYWIRTLRSWKGQLVDMKLRDGSSKTGRLVGADAEGPTLEVGETRQRACKWPELQSVETATED